VTFNQTRTDRKKAPTCSFTGVVANIENFLSGTQDMRQGGWEEWFNVTSNPAQFTPYGSDLGADVTMRAALTNRKGQQLDLVKMGEGFLSAQICEIVDGAGTPREECIISKPGQIIQESLNKALGVGPDKLVVADEINEIVTALLGQLVQTAITGANGLLGLSGSTGFTYTNRADGFTMEQLVDEASAALDPDLLADRLEEVVDAEAAALAYSTTDRISELDDFIDDNESSTDATDIDLVARAQGLRSDMQTILDRSVDIPNNIASGTAFINELRADPPPNVDRVEEIVDEFNEFTFANPGLVDALRAEYNGILNR
jgi:hypothetical protein